MAKGSGGAGRKWLRTDADWLDAKYPPHIYPHRRVLGEYLARNEYTGANETRTLMEVIRRDSDRGYRARITFGDDKVLGPWRDTLKEARADLRSLRRQARKIVKQSGAEHLEAYIKRTGRRMTARYPGFTIYGERFDAGTPIVYSHVGGKGVIILAGGKNG